jgi:hypothetical protein
MGRGEPGQAAIEVNLAVYDNALRARLLERIEAVAGTIVRSAGGTLRSGSTMRCRPSLTMTM